MSSRRIPGECVLSIISFVMKKDLGGDIWLLVISPPIWNMVTLSITIPMHFTSYWVKSPGSPLINIWTILHWTKKRGWQRCRWEWWWRWKVDADKFIAVVRGVTGPLMRSNNNRGEFMIVMRIAPKKMVHSFILQEKLQTVHCNTRAVSFIFALIQIDIWDRLTPV